MNPSSMTANAEASAIVRTRLARLPAPGLLEAVAEIGVEPVFLVGGSVRDLLLGTAITDIDVVVEGDAIGFARTLATVLEVDCVEYEQFQTAVLTLRGSGGPIDVDVAGARSETYSTAGALPNVEPAPLEVDLARRDFTINAMACSLARADLGATYTPLGGYDDLRSGIIRVLHERSFEDDPTRLLRAARYAARFNFEIEPGTAELMRRAARAGRLGDLDSARVRDELVDLLAEARFLAGLERLGQFGVDQALHPRLSCDRETLELIGAREQVQACAGLEYSPILVRLAGVLRRMRSSELTAFMDRLKFSGVQRDALLDAVMTGERLGDQLQGGPKIAPSALRSMLMPHSNEALRIASTRGDRAWTLVEVFSTRLRESGLEIDGRDLLAAGAQEGPQIGDALSETLALKLDGFVSGRADELETALRLLGLRGVDQ